EFALAYVPSANRYSMACGHDLAILGSAARGILKYESAAVFAGHSRSVFGSECHHSGRAVSDRLTDLGHPSQTTALPIRFQTTLYSVAGLEFPMKSRVFPPPFPPPPGPHMFLRNEEG